MMLKVADGLARRQGEISSPGLLVSLPPYLIAGLIALLCLTSTTQADVPPPPLWRVTLRASEDSDAEREDKERPVPLVPWSPTSPVSDESPLRTIEGRILVEAQDGGILLEDRAGVFWNITPEEQADREQTDRTYTSMSAEELSAQLLGELGKTFQIVTTEHYVIATAGSRLHAEWCGVLFERLLKAFQGYWRSAEIQIHDPLTPLPVVIYRDRASFAKVAQVEAGPAFAEANGYYSMKTNRIVLFDPTGSDLRSVKDQRPLRTRGDMQRFMASDPTPVSTIVHEATHQIAFNCGLHTRYADNPVWLTEGMALFFEVPDLRSSNGWRTIGRVNRSRLSRFRQFLHDGRPADSLTSLIADDERFRDPPAIEAAYAEAWVFTRFLITKHRRQYETFLNKCSENTHLQWKSRDERLHDFEDAFGMSPDALEAELLRDVSRLR